MDSVDTTQNPTSENAAEQAPPKAARTRKAATKRSRKATSPSTEAGPARPHDQAQNQDQPTLLPATDAGTEPGSGGAAAAESADAAPKAKKAARKRASNKAAAPPAEVSESAGSPAQPTAEPVPDASSTAASDTSQPPTQERPRGRSRRASAPTTAPPAFGVLFQPPAPQPAPEVPTADPPSSDAASGPEGQAGEPTKKAAKRTRKSGKSAAKEATAAPAGRGERADRTDQDLAQHESNESNDGRDSADSTDSDSTDSATTDSDSTDTDSTDGSGRRRRRRGGKGRGGRSSGESQSDGAGDSREDSAASSAQSGASASGDEGDSDDADGAGSRRRRRRRRSGAAGESSDPPGTTTRVREPRKASDEVTSLRGSTRLEAKKQRRREGREAGRRRTVITEAEFLARRESVDRVMVVREKDERIQIGVLEDGVLVEHFVSKAAGAASSLAGNVYLGRVQNVLPSMEAAFVDIGKGRNAVLYAGEVNWDAAGLGGQPKRIEYALKSGESVLVQVTKDPIGQKGARLTSQVSLPGRYLVYVPGNPMTGISRKLPDAERARLRQILREIVPDDAGVIVRTAAEGASETELRADVERLTAEWDRIQKAATSQSAPTLLHGEPDLTVRVIRDVFNEDFARLVVSGDSAWETVREYVDSVAPDLAPRLERWTGDRDVFAGHRIDEQLAKAMDRKVWLPSGGSLVIDRTEAMTVVDVNTGKFVGSGGNLEETVTRNNIEAAEEIVRQLRLRDIGGIIVVDFIDMVLESNRDLVVRRLIECLGRDRTKHQVAEVTSLGLVQMTRKRVGSGLLEIFSEPCEACGGRGVIVHSDPVDKGPAPAEPPRNSRGKRSRSSSAPVVAAPEPAVPSGPTPAHIAAAAHAAALNAASSVLDSSEHEEYVDADARRDAIEALADAVEDAVVRESGAPVEGAQDGRRDQRAADAAQSAAPMTTASAPESAPAPAARPRRRRGRVVAPAGPPPGADGDGPPAVITASPPSSEAPDEVLGRDGTATDGRPGEFAGPEHEPVS